MINIRKIITKIKCLSSSIQYKKGMFIHPLCSIQQKKGGKVNCSEGVLLQNNTLVKAEGKAEVSLGKGCFLNANTRVDSFYKIIIEDNVIIGPFVYIADFNHEYRDISKPIKEQPYSIGGGYKNRLRKLDWST